MDDLPVFLQMFVRLLAIFAFGAWLQSLTPHKSEKESSDHPAATTEKTSEPEAKPAAKPAPETAK